MREDDVASSPQAPAGRTYEPAASVQANLGKQAKVPADSGKGYVTRDWSLFFFFRILREVEMRETGKRLRAAIEHVPAAGTDDAGESFLSDKAVSPARRLKLDLAYPGVLNGGLGTLVRKQKQPMDEDGEDADDDDDDRTGGSRAENVGQQTGPAAPAGESRSEVASAHALHGDAYDQDPPAQAFLDWLNLLVRGDGAKLMASAKALGDWLPAAPAGEGTFSLDRPDALAGIEAATRLFAVDFQRNKMSGTLAIARRLDELLSFLRANHAAVMASVRATLDAPPDDSPHGPLGRMVLYEMLRQAAPLFTDDALPVLRGEAGEEKRKEQADPIDRTPIMMAFSYSGLATLKLDENTLASFPEAFREGMAARAARLGDVAGNAPEHWEGELGLRSVHGYFTGGSNLNRSGRPPSERFWKSLRQEIRQFNDPTLERGSELRAWLGQMFRLVGLEIVHIELGQDPYRVNRAHDPEGALEHPRHRVEHFGFRDGLSQPFVDLGLADTKPGGGTADRRGTWSPVARGEIFLDEEDETGRKHLLPLHPALRDGSTYLVFRKLAQDVEGFRSFLELQHPDDSQARGRLAAQFFGRWPNGTSLVRSPHAERSTEGAENEAALNDFRYAADDPLGRKCPLSAHVRRANPRDTGGRNDVRHHRILRRGIAYGGPLLDEGQADDGEERGILFIAANARIDLQFEVVQGDWINGGEFLGQAGLNRCPVTGANDGGVRDSFLAANAAAPVTGLPSFVTTRGGDYFFAPGIPALAGIADGKDFRVRLSNLPFRGHAMGDALTPSLFSEERVSANRPRLLGMGRPLRLGPSVAGGGPPPDKVAFVGRYNQVKEVLSNGKTDDGTGVYFSVEPYLAAGRRITRGETFLIGTDRAGATAETRARLFTVLNEAWNRLKQRWEERDPPPTVRGAARARLEAALRRTAGRRRIDLVDDLAVQAAYGVIDKVFGMRGPAWLTEMAAALPFARQHVGDLPADWIAAFKGERPADPGLTTMQVWNCVLVADLIANVQGQQPLQVLARQAGSEMLNHIDYSLARARARGAVTDPRSLVDTFVLNQQRPSAAITAAYARFGPAWGEVYYKDAAIILLETLGSTLAVVPLTFGSVMTTLLELRIDLSLLLPRLQPGGLAHVVYEAERLNPNSTFRVRRCAFAKDIGGVGIEPGDYVAAVIKLANADRKIFWKPERFSLGESDPLSDDFARFVRPNKVHPRDPQNYLLFGVQDSEKKCWGQGPVAMPILEECVRACGRLEGLRGVAGPRGIPQKLAGVTIGLPARFTRIAN
jgi:deferrochelatase/peroxidase EfeB